MVCSVSAHILFTNVRMLHVSIYWEFAWRYFKRKKTFCQIYTNFIFIYMYNYSCCVWLTKPLYHIVQHNGMAPVITCVRVSSGNYKLSNKLSKTYAVLELIFISLVLRCIAVLIITCTTQDEMLLFTLNSSLLYTK